MILYGFYVCTSARPGAYMLYVQFKLGVLKQALLKLCHIQVKEVQIQANPKIFLFSYLSLIFPAEYKAWHYILFSATSFILLSTSSTSDDYAMIMTMNSIDCLSVRSAKTFC